MVVIVFLLQCPPGILSPRDFLIKHLKEVYTGPGWYKRGSGPKPTELKYINLALIKKRKIKPNERHTDKFLRDSLHGLIDDIADNKKMCIKVPEIFDYDASLVKRVLVEGAPGIGKTMLAHHLCAEWARGKLLQEYDCVLLVPLRRFQGKIQSSISLPEYQQEKELQVSDLVKVYLGGERGFQASEDLIRKGGENVLLILEGWDELSPELREEYSFFSRIINGDLLTKASVMVTSRPTVSSSLYEHFDRRRIEVLGFTQEQIKEYIEKNLPVEKNAILNHLRKFPNIQALSHIPLTLSIICSVVRQEQKLPVTLTELYNRYVIKLLYAGLKKQPEFKQLQGLGTLSDLPREAQNVFQDLCQLALNGLRKKQFVFRVKDLKSVSLDPVGSFDGYGILSSIPCYAGAGYEVLFQFRHLTVQEFMAAKHIEGLDHCQLMALLEEYRMDKQFLVVWKFLSGITRLEDEDLQQSIIYSTRKQNNLDTLFLLHCIYETQNPQLCYIAAAYLSNKAVLSNKSLNATDCLCLAYVITQAGGEWQLLFRGCNMGGEGLEILRWHLVTHYYNDDHPLKLSLLE